MRFDCRNDDEFDRGLAAAEGALGLGQLVVLPTDTVYGIAADAFCASAVQLLLDAKGRSRQMPPPVLVGAAATLEALAVDIPTYVREMIAAMWPGALTIICKQQPSLRWDLGETRNTVAVRMPNDPYTLALLKHTGPLAVSSANLTGEPAARTIDEAEHMLGESVAVYFDGGPSPSAVPSTILDITGITPRVLRAGAIGLEALREFNNTIKVASE